MKTITFYSYKGGVGRTLTLSNIATRLSELGKRVCLLDFDLEAPGIPFKFRNNKIEIKSGLIDYIFSYSHNKVIPDKIKDYSITIDPLNLNYLPIHLIPAGNINTNEYWKKLSMINWSEMFYSENGQGVRFILDLKAKIEKEFSPDVLLIDSRTGITDISGITLKLLADEVVILSSYNDEGLFGSKKIIKSLLDKTNTLFGKTPGISFILTRLPFRDMSSDKARENTLLTKVKDDLVNYLGISELEISIIHSDRRLEENERQLIGYEYEEKNVSISNDYLKLFDKLTSDILTKDELILFKNKKNAEKEFNKSQFENEFSKKIQYLNKAIELDNTKWEYLYNRALVYSVMAEYEKAIKDYNKSLELNPNNARTFLDIAYCYYKINELNKAIEYSIKSKELDSTNISVYTNLSFYLEKLGQYDEAITLLNQALEIENTNDRVFNCRADLLRNLGRIQEAYLDIYKAIDLNSKNHVYFGTLAEIFASDGKMNEFYFNLNIALGMGLSAKEMRSAKDVYSKFVNEERFINLLKKYDVDIDEIIVDEI
jgi:tetratricopeptide (TPR) repeat protein